MNAMTNETRLWFCYICVKRNFIKTKPKHKNSKSHKHKKQYGTVVREYEFFRPENDKVPFILKDTDKVCKIKFSIHLVSVACNKFTNMENNEEIVLTITLGYKKVKSQFIGLNRKNQKCTKKLI